MAEPVTAPVTVDQRPTSIIHTMLAILIAILVNFAIRFAVEWFLALLDAFKEMSLEVTVSVVGLIVGISLGAAYARDACDRFAPRFHHRAVAAALMIASVALFAAALAWRPGLALSVNGIIGLVISALAAWAVFWRTDEEQAADATPAAAADTVPASAPVPVSSN